MMVECPIDCNGIEHKQIYAQLKAEILSGERYWFTKEEEQVLQKNNLPFYRQGPVEDVLRSCYRSVEKGEEGELRSAAEIFPMFEKAESVSDAWGESGKSGANSGSGGDRTEAYKVWKCISGGKNWVKESRFG